MIKSITIENFQSHEYSELNFHEGVNVIAGPSDSGKSSIIKAIRWLKDNRPSGEDFKNWNARKQDQVGVEIETNGQQIAIIRKDGKTNYFDVNHSYMAINKDVPSEITEALNINDYNLQTQFQPYFLLQDSPGEVSRRLNELVGLDIIDTLYQNLASEIRKANASIFAMKSEMENCVKALEEYKNLAEIEKIIIRIEKNYQKTVENTSTVNFLTENVNMLEAILEERENTNNLIELEKPVQSIIKKINKHDELRNTLISLESYKENLENFLEEKTNEKFWQELEKPCTTILNNIEKLSSIKKGKQNLESILTMLSNIQSQRERHLNIKKESTDKYMALLEKENICPISQIPFPKQCITKIKENL